MKIKNIHLNHLRNAEHYQFMLEAKELIAEHTAKLLSVEAIFADFTRAFGVENEAYQIITKSASTKDLEVADARRDTAFSGLRDQINSLKKHFNLESSKAAYRLSIVFDTYGNLSKKTYTEETASLYNLVEDLKTEYDDDVRSLSLNEWVDELSTANRAFDELMQTRYNESGERDAIARLKTARQGTSELYQKIVERINAGIVFNGGEKYELFVQQLNARITRYHDVLAQRRGISKAKADKEKEAKAKAEQAKTAAPKPETPTA